MKDLIENQLFHIFSYLHSIPQSLNKYRINKGWQAIKKQTIMKIPKSNRLTLVVIVILSCFQAVNSQTVITYGETKEATLSITGEIDTYIFNGNAAKTFAKH